MKTFDFYMDPGHGWLKVPIALLTELGIVAKISAYSYKRDGNAYLEEDMDAGTFIVAFEKAKGFKPKFRSHNSDKSSRIRNYESFA